MTATAKSPLTELVGDSQGGGFFPAEMKFAGFDAIVVRGRAAHPVYLWVHDGSVEIRSAQHLWGRVTGEVERLIRQELGDDKIQVAQCGPAGDRLVRFAAIMNMCSRACGRTGMGAVMGSKNLKAVAVRGKAKPRLADRQALIRLAKWGVDHLPESAIYGLKLLGTAGNVRNQQNNGGLPTRNWTSGVFEGWQGLDGRTIADTIFKERDSCFGCAVNCKRVVQVSEGQYPIDPQYGGPEYESLSALGSYCGVSDTVAVAYANQLCNMYGMDTISCGATIAWAMDCFEHGILTKKDTGGIELRFGNAEGLVRMIDMIGKREGFGNLLAEGSARAAAAVGRGAEELTVTVKKQEIPAHMPQVKRSLALIYAVNPFGPDHQSSEHDPEYASPSSRLAEIGLTSPQPTDVLNEEKARFALLTHQAYSACDSLSVCSIVFGPAWQLYGMTDLAQVLGAATGWQVTLQELMRLGERRLNMLQSFNAREGWRRNGDVLPTRLGQPLLGGPSEGTYVTRDEVEKAKDWYYSMAGWDISTGVPTRARLRELELDWLADMLRV
jgi:aldehyde:ferredoxin oxidoreductase